MARFPAFVIEVRHALPEDAFAIAQVQASTTAALRRIYRPNAKALANKSRISRDLERLVALVDGLVVGTVQHYLDEDRLRIVGLGVLEEYRKRGVAKALVESLVSLAKHKRLEGIAARTVRETGNVPVFEKLGFVVASDVPDEYSESDIYPVLRDVELFRRVTGIR